MFHPTFVQLKYWFYPVGNTPAVNLLRDLPIADEQEIVRILALGCGDPRNILFTLWCEHGHQAKRLVEYTCCDIEPAVLARNVVLFTLIIERTSSSKLWELFYHFYVPEESRRDLEKHAARLLEVSGSVEEWSRSPYGKVVRWVNKSTLQQMRQYWTHYASSQEWPQARTAISQRSREIGADIHLTGMRSAGPFWFNATKTMSYVYQKYWETGVAGGNSEDRTQLGKKGKVNPMFAVSSAATGEFAVHYGTEPLLGFHLAEAFQHENLAGGNSALHADLVVKVAKKQFGAWCDSFRDHVEIGHLHIDLFCGDALALGHALQLNHVLPPSEVPRVSTFTKPWSACPLLLDGKMGLNGQDHCVRELFDVIDTSNLGDHLGLINVLTATAPLLRRSAFSTLYNESLLMASDDISASLNTALGSDASTFSLLLGLVPSGLVTGATAAAVGNEAGLFSLAPSEGHQRQYRMRVSWKSPEYIDPAAVKLLKISKTTKIQVAFDARNLANCLFRIYLAMFAHEDASKLTARMQRLSTGTYFDTHQRYTRAAIVALLRLVKVRAKVDWEQMMSVFCDHVDKDRTLIVGSNGLQELYMYLHLLGVWTSGAMKSNPENLRNEMGLPIRTTNDDTGVLAKRSPPSVVCLLLVVPRERLKIFTGKLPDAIGTPSLHISVTQIQGQNQFDNHFYSFHSFFGQIKGSADASEVSITQEDDEGWAGSANLILSCMIPTFGLLTGPRSGIRASLAINADLDTMMRFRDLGPRMSIFEAGLADQKNLFICEKMPKLDPIDARSTPNHWIQDLKAFHSSPIQSLVKFNSDARATHVQSHVDIPKDSAEGRDLANGAEVKAVESSPCTLIIRIGETYKKDIVFAFPIQSSRPKVRIARKSSWIEVEVPINTVLEGDRFSSWTQLVPDNHHRYVCWSLPRINLEIQPVINIPKKANTQWIQTFMGTTLSDAERLLNAQGLTSTKNPKVDLKESINALFAAFAGRHPSAMGRSIRTFQLAIESTGCHTTILATAIRHDLDLGSIVLEGYVIPFTIPKVKTLHSALSQLQHKHPLAINLSNEESTLWRKLLPALAERCRTWKHKPTCEYLSHGPPVSIEEGQSPLCTCGEGVITGPELAKLGIKEWAPFAKYATRIAIPPIFPIPYIESSMSDLKNSKRFDTATTTKALNEVSSDSDKCEHCGNSSGTLKTCKGCGKAKYCGQTCQKAAWKSHKIQCKAA